MAAFRHFDYYQLVKISHLRCLTIAGVATLFLGLAGSVHATSFPLADALGSGIRFGNEHNNPGGYEAARTFSQGNLYEQYARPTQSIWSGHDFAHNAGVIRDHYWSDSPTGLPLTPAKPVTPTGDGAPASSVPDGGSTAIMMGAALVGLACVQKRMRA
jgi:hypothetical protein